MATRGIGEWYDSDVDEDDEAWKKKMKLSVTTETMRMRREMPGRATLLPPYIQPRGRITAGQRRRTTRRREQWERRWWQRRGRRLGAESEDESDGEKRRQQSPEKRTNSLTAFRNRGGRGRRRRSSVRRSPLSLPQSTSRPPPLTLAYVSYITLLHLILRHIRFLPLSLNVRRRRGRQFCHCICSSDPREPHRRRHDLVRWQGDML